MKGLKDWINTQPNEDGKELHQLWDVLSSYKEEYHPNVENAHDKFMKKVGSKEDNSAIIVPIRRGSSQLLKMAAMIAVLLAGGIALKQLFVSETSMEQIVTSNAEQKNVSLEDGTIVNINSNSRLDFPLVYGENVRKVNLSGEAFFQVTRDESKPFLIETEKAEIEVLGTSFNVRSFSQENYLEVFVETGTVKVQILGQKDAHILSAGEMLSFHFDKKTIEKTATNPENAKAWKSGKLRFKNEPMGEIFKALEKLHGVSIEVARPSLKACPFTINMNSLDMQEAIHGLEVACDLKFTKTGDKKYEVNGSCCD